MFDKSLLHWAMIYQIKTNSPLQNYSYLIEYQKGKFWCIDPFDAVQINQEVEKRLGQLEVIINTHEHWDHYQGNDELIKKWKCEVWAHPKAKGLIPNVSRTLQNGESLIMQGDHSIEIMDTPGHTFAHLSLLVKKQETPEAIFTGDTFFNAGVGNCRNGGDPLALYQTIKKYYETLPDQVLIYPGHDYLQNNLKFTLSLEKDNQVAKDWLAAPSKTSTIGDEKSFNLFLRLQEKTVQATLGPGPTNEEQFFIELRKRRDQW